MTVTAVFTNTKDVTPPKTDNPNTPNKPNKPNKPVNSSKPDKPQISVITDTPNQDVSAPKTGDDTNLKLYLSLFIMSSLFLVILKVMYRNRTCKKDN